MTAAELKARLLAKAEAIINERVEQEPKTLGEMEEAVLKAGIQLKEAMLREVVASQSGETGVESCSTCGSKLKHKGKRGKWVLTQAGEVRIERDDYYCERCKAGFFPQG